MVGLAMVILWDEIVGFLEKEYDAWTRTETASIFSALETAERINSVRWSWEREELRCRQLLREVPGTTGHLRDYDCEEARQPRLGAGVCQRCYRYCTGQYCGRCADRRFVEQPGEIQQSLQRFLH